jgi:Ca2+-binding EF-hand superfamily protein
VKGDPYQRSQRLFIVSVHVLLAMTINIAFFDEYDECVYRCDAHMPAGTDDPTTTDPACVACPVETEWKMCGLGANAPVEGARECTQEELPDVTTSLVTVLIVVPIIGLVNLLFSWLRKPLVADVMVRSGEMWARLKAESISERARKRESQMLAAMTPKQVLVYAQETTNSTTQEQRLDTDSVKRIMETTQEEQREELERLHTELKEHAANQKENMHPTLSHQACIKAVFMTEQLIERRQKEELSKLLLEDHKKVARSNLTRELNGLALQQLRERQQKHRIKFTVEDEDAWAHGGVYDHSSAEDTMCLDAEERRHLEQHQKEAQAQIDEEKRMLIDLIANAELRSLSKWQRFRHRITASRPTATLKNCIAIQRHCCAAVCPWCDNTISATFEEDGPLGLKFAADGAYVKIVAIKEYYQADENDRIHVGLVLRAINGNNVVSTHRHDILRMLHSAGRPTTLTFAPDSDDLDTSDSEDDDHSDDDDAVGGVDAFWDDEEILAAVVVEDIEAPTVAESNENVSCNQAEQVSLELREYGVALIARQRLVDEVASIEADVAANRTNRARKVKELNAKRDGLTAADKYAAVAVAAARYDFAKCTVHVERVPDSLGPDGIESLFSVFGRVLQVTVQRRPGFNSNWALVTMSDIDYVRTLLNYSQHSNIELTEDQQMQLQCIELLQASKLYESSYGRSWLEANERAEASIRGLALHNDAQVRNDFGVFESSAQSENGNKKGHAAPRRRAPVCERRRQVAAQMRVCETAVDALFYACDRDNSGTLDREELAMLMAELNGGPRVSEFAVQFVIDQVQSHGDGAITREELKPAITLWRYLQHEQDFVANEFDAFDKRTKGRIIGKNEVGLLLKRLNSDKHHPEGIAPSVAEVEWVMKKALGSGGAIRRAELRAAVALWYPYVYNRRRVEDLPATVQSKAGRRRRALAGMLNVHKHHVSMVLASRYPSLPDPDNPARIMTYSLTMQDLRLTMSELISSVARREQVSEQELQFVASTADLQGAETFGPTDIQAALAMWLCTRDVQAELTAALQQYDETKTGLDQRQNVHTILTELNDGIPVTPAESNWILESSDIDGNGTISREELRGSLGWWFLHVSRGRTLKTKRGWAAALPWLMSAAIGLLCTYLVAATSVRFTEEKTQRWLENTILAVVFKQLIVDPLKVLFCGTLLEPVATLFSLDMGLGEIDLSEALGEAMEDMGEDASDSIGTMMVVQSLAGGRDWNRDAELTANQIRKDAHQNVFLAGSRSVAKMKSIGQAKQVRSHALQAATEAARDSQRTLQRMQSQRAEMNSVYAKKIAEKRLKKGLNRGTYAARAESDMVAVSQFMAAEQENVREEQREVLAEIKDLQAQEQTLLSAPATSRQELQNIRDRLARAEARRRIIVERQGDLEHKEGNEKLLLAKAKREDDEHQRHISHLQGLSSAKTRERVRRKRDEKRGVVPQEDAGAAVSRSRWRTGQRGKNILGLARMVSGSSQIAVRAEKPIVGDPVEADEMTSVMLADAGLRRSGTRPKQLKVAMTTGPLPGATPQRSLIDEVDEMVADEGVSTEAA